MTFMRKYLALTAICVYSLFSHAQNIGIGTPNPQNKLHVAGGFRLDTLTGVNGAGLLKHDANGVVYGIKFSANANDVLRGDGTFGPYNPAINGALGWLLSGNSGTNPATNFLGTTDDQPLLIRVNNIRHGYIGSSIFFGSGAGLLNTTSGKIGLGSGALGKHTSNSNSSMVAIGDSTLYNTTFGFENIAIGGRSMYSNTSGATNVAIGMYSMEKNTYGGTNIAIGNYALRNNVDGHYNTGIGYLSLFSNTSGSTNTAVGNYSLQANTTGYGNTGIGYAANLSSLTANNNTAVGFLTMYFNKANDNSALGYRALYQNTFGIANNGFGAYALEKNQTGGANSAFGFEALRNTTGYHNTAMGTAASKSALFANGNTAIGSYALYNNLTGSNNTVVGYYAGLSLPNNVNNVTCIGTATGWNTTLNNQVNIGDFSVTWIGGQTGWFHYSDKRIKNDIREDVPGIEFIKRLKPITYHVDINRQEEIANAGRKLDYELGKEAMKDWEGKYDIEKIKMSGFFAQDVEEAAKEINYSFNGVHNPKNGGLYSLDYSAFVVPLVKAVQEQQKVIEDQDKKIEKQQQQIDLLIKEMQRLRNDLVTQKN